MFSSVHRLRGVAAVAVAFLHALHFDGIAVPRLHAGVDLFFVISGFVLYVSAYERQTALGAYAWRRAIRVLPLWWVAVIATLPALWLSGGLTGAKPVLDTLIFATNEPVLPVGWTLKLELVFYLIFGLALWLRDWRVALGLLVGLVTLGLVWQSTFWTTPFLGEFALGLLIARYRERLALWMLPAGLVLLALVPAEPGDWRALAFGVPTALVLAGGLAFERRGWLAGGRLADHLGSASYAIYLFHWPLLVAGFALAGDGAHWLPATLVAVALSCALHRWLERPMMHGLRRVRVVVEPVPEAWPEAPRRGAA